jgi:spore coat protein U-like protein
MHPSPIVATRCRLNIGGVRFGDALTRAIAFALGAFGLVLPSFAQIQGCTFSAQPLAFGAYDVASTAPLVTTARLEIRCNRSSSLTVGIQSANAAHSGQFRSLRHVASGESLPYMLFQDAALTRVWGDGTRQAGRSIVTTGDTNLFVYGAVAAGQDPAAGEYRDTLTIVVLP